MIIEGREIELEPWQNTILATLARNGDLIYAVKLCREWSHLGGNDFGLLKSKRYCEAQRDSPNVVAVTKSLAHAYLEAWRDTMKVKYLVQSRLIRFEFDVQEGDQSL